MKDLPIARVRSTKPTTQDEYIDALPPELRVIAARMRAAVHASAPDVTEAIKYGMPAFLIGGSAFLYFAVWKKHVGVYPIYGAPPELEAKLAPYRHGKDTVRFSLAGPIDDDLIARLVKLKLDNASPSEPRFASLGITTTKQKRRAPKR